MAKWLHRPAHPTRDFARGAVRGVSRGVADSRFPVIFSVWAPHARTVDLILGEQRIALAPLAGGYWQAEVAADTRQGYRYSIDGAAPVPDPRSRRQPDGVHGASHVVEAESLAAAAQDGSRAHREFRAVPLTQAIIYEL